MGFRPPDIHPKEHFRPILALSAAGSWMDRYYRAVGIMIAGKKSLNFCFRDLVFQCTQLFFDFTGDIFPFFM